MKNLKFLLYMFLFLQIACSKDAEVEKETLIDSDANIETRSMCPTIDDIIFEAIAEPSTNISLDPCSNVRVNFGGFNDPNIDCFEASFSVFAFGSLLELPIFNIPNFVTVFHDNNQNDLVSTSPGLSLYNYNSNFSSPNVIKIAYSGLDVNYDQNETGSFVIEADHTATYLIVCLNISFESCDSDCDPLPAACSTIRIECS